MGEPSRVRPARRPVDPRARERLREAQAAETCALAAVCDAGAKVASATARCEKARALADTWVAAATSRLATARTDLVAVSGLDRAAALLGISKGELRRPRTSASDEDGAA